MHVAFIDGQNLYLGTQSEGWKVDLYRFRVYLKEKYNVTKAYYFLGFLNENLEELYTDLQDAGFIVIFREHNQNMLGRKKGNVDTDIVFEMMKRLVDVQEGSEKFILVSGDGDYKKVVDYLIKKQKFLRLLFPNNKASSLYKKLGSEYYSYLRDIKEIIQYLYK